MRVSQSPLRSRCRGRVKHGRNLSSGWLAQLVGALSQYAKVAGVSPSQGTYATNKRINKQNNKPMFLSLSFFPPTPQINFKKMLRKFIRRNICDGTWGGGHERLIPQVWDRRKEVTMYGWDVLDCSVVQGKFGPASRKSSHVS